MHACVHNLCVYLQKAKFHRNIFPKAISHGLHWKDNSMKENGGIFNFSVLFPCALITMGESFLANFIM